MQERKGVVRRRHDAELKRQVLAACEEAGSSVAAVAMAHGLNANLVHRWRYLAEGHDGAPARTDLFVQRRAEEPDRGGAGLGPGGAGGRDRGHRA
jgi:transposase